MMRTSKSDSRFMDTPVLVLCPISNCRNFAVIPAEAGIQKSLPGAGFRPIPGRNDEPRHISVIYGTAH